LQLPPSRTPPFPYTPLFRSAHVVLDPARCGAHARKQSAAADWHDQRVEFGHVLEHLQRHRPLPRRDVRMVEGMDKGESAFLFKRSEEHTSELQSRENLVCRL